MDVSQSKRQLRAQAAGLRGAITAEQAHRMGLAMRDSLLTMPQFRQAECVFCFVGVGGEPDTRPIMEAILSGGKRLCVPKVVGKGQMDAVALADLSLLFPGKYGIPEPAEGSIVLPEQIGLVLLPCLAATPGGQRLGHGGGFYDRFLSRFSGTGIILCPDALLMPHVPLELHDRPADYVLTETHLY